jgi:hypothetical protein
VRGSGEPVEAEPEAAEDRERRDGQAAHQSESLRHRLEREQCEDEGKVEVVLVDRVEGATNQEEEREQRQRPVGIEAPPPPQGCKRDRKQDDERMAHGRHPGCEGVVGEDGEAGELHVLGSRERKPDRLRRGDVDDVSLDPRRLQECMRVAGDERQVERGRCDRRHAGDSPTLSGCGGEQRGHDREERPLLGRDREPEREPCPAGPPARGEQHRGDAERTAHHLLRVPRLHGGDRRGREQDERGREREPRFAPARGSS